jgi:sarcosine oxidase subunit alpha
MNVDNQPNVKACTTLAREGMVAKQQNAWPSLDHDVSSVIDKFSFVLPVGFYYKSFIRPRWLWPLVRGFIRRAAGYGEVNTSLQRSDEEYEHEHRHVDIAVIGGGPAGLSAAVEASRLGHKVLLLDDQSELGGHLRYKNQPCENCGEFSGLKGFEMAAKLADGATASNIEIFNNSTCFGLYEGNLVGASQGRKLFKIRAKRIIVCTGCFERPFAFANNDLPGIFLGEGIQRLVNQYGVKPGTKVLVVTNNKYGYEIASDLYEAGIQVSGLAIATGGPVMDSSLRSKLMEKGTQLLDGYTIIEATGGREVTGAVLVKQSEKNGLVPGSEMTLTCDVIVLSIGFEPANALLLQAGCEATFDEALGQSIILTMVPGIYAAGDVTGIHDLQIATLQGKLAGLQAATSLADGHGESNFDVSNEIGKYSEELRGLTEQYKAQTHPGLLYEAPGGEGKRLVCLCEDVTDDDMRLAIEEGFDDIETLKRYTTFTMGPCQGKNCSLVCSAIHAKETGLRLADVKRTTSRPPYQPLTTGVLNGPPHRPVKFTALHHKHVALNAVMMDMGEWKRPKSYGSLEEEYRAIRERVGIIDVSTLGRFSVKGPDAGKFLDLLYTHIYSNLKVGKARYALLLTETGKVLDDGIIARLAEDEYFVTSSTGNADFVEQLLKWWQVTGSLDVSITNITSGLAAINVAGPRSRELLSRLVDIDLSKETSPYMTCSKANVAGVPAIMLRIGFVGEVGWEIHFPAECAEYLWDKLITEGKEYNIMPVGVEAMRLLSLDKRHIWPTLDTDAASDALETDLGWAIKFEKPDFIGKHYLLKTQAEGMHQKIVGLVVKGEGKVESGDVIVAEGKPVGRITTAGFSYAKQKYVAIAWVPAQFAKDHSTVPVIHDGRPVDTEVQLGPFYDPEGQRMKS